ncbi:putative dehydrogenase [Piedraia hortae CBS 480.64]|uniref:Putative dehydrogenase n=1 Tax=Piedraia hortae CBS 480.64 TaxID=1314780 RepID=A0A6A7BXS3_9PEZI|nr:putative dehydrogenase [Piedraia hortae CBS 480.64]
MPHVLIIGGGFAGVWAAAGIKRIESDNPTHDPITVTLIAPTDDIVIRPRLYENHPENMRVPLDHILGPINASRIHATVTHISPTTKSITFTNQDSTQSILSYDKLILASGSQLNPPTLPGSEHLFNIDTLTSAASLNAHLHNLPHTHATHAGQYTVIVVGAGFTGLEIATELPSLLAPHPARVILLERSAVLSPSLGAGPRPYIQSALTSLGVETRLNTSLASLSPEGATLSSGEFIPSATVIWTVGMHASPLTSQINSPRDELGRLVVDTYLRVKGVEDVYACGDTAAAPCEQGHTSMQSCQHALPMGKVCGANVAREVLKLPLVEFKPEGYVTCLDLGAAGAVFAKGWDRRVELQGEEGKQVKGRINTRWIYPPIERGTLLEDAGEVGWPG